MTRHCGVQPKRAGRLWAGRHWAGRLWAGRLWARRLSAWRLWARRLLAWRRATSLLVAGLLAGGCHWDDGGSANTNANYNNGNTAIDPDCTQVRFTRYTASARGWCGFDRTSSVLPAFVRDGLTFAIAEPWAGGSYEGEAGEACGECWEVSNAFTTQILMVHDLCPIEGNPVCAGDFFHFDLASEAADALQTGGSGSASARRVPCPVTGNIHVQISDWNQWGYQQLAFLNERIPLRAVSLRATPDGTWIPMERSGGRFSVLDGPVPADGDGVVYRVESAQGQVLEGTNVLPFTTVDPGGTPLLHDIGAQFDDLQPHEGVCEYSPPGLVYGDAYGGIPGLRWMPNPWGGTQVTETGEGCHAGTSCLRVDDMVPGAGFHIYVWNAFPADSFATLTIWARTLEGTSSLGFGPAGDGGTCGEQQVQLTTEWAYFTVDLATGCAETPLLDTVTFHNGQGVSLLLDDVQFQ